MVPLFLMKDNGLCNMKELLGIFFKEKIILRKMHPDKEMTQKSTSRLFTCDIHMIRDSCENF